MFDVFMLVMLLMFVLLGPVYSGVEYYVKRQDRMLHDMMERINWPVGNACCEWTDVSINHISLPELLIRIEPPVPHWLKVRRAKVRQAIRHGGTHHSPQADGDNG